MLPLPMIEVSSPYSTLESKLGSHQLECCAGREEGRCMRTGTSRHAQPHLQAEVVAELVEGDGRAVAALQEGSGGGGRG